jgi:hypothetical protein
MINKAKNASFIAFLPIYFLSLYEIELQEEHYRLLVSEKGICCQFLGLVVNYQE